MVFIQHCGLYIPYDGNMCVHVQIVDEGFPDEYEM